jgi:hypothetical protein
MTLTSGAVSFANNDSTYRLIPLSATRGLINVSLRFEVNLVSAPVGPFYWTFDLPKLPAQLSEFEIVYFINSSSSPRPLATTVPTGTEISTTVPLYGVTLTSGGVFNGNFTYECIM